MGIDPAQGQIANSSPAIVVNDVIIVGNSAMHGYYPLRLHNLPGYIRGFDVHTGKQLWKFKTGSSVNAPPITYTYKGRQYVTVLSGIGGLYWNINRENLKDKVAPGGTVWTFALLPQ
jgi:glucose dehydrogenase